MAIFDHVNSGLIKRKHLARKKQRALNETPLSQRVSSLRKATGITMTTLAERIGVTPSYVSLLEAGERQPSREIVRRLAELFFNTNDLDSLDELLVLAGFSPTRYELQVEYQDTLSVYEELLRLNPHDFKTYTATTRLLIREQRITEAEDKILAGMKVFIEAYQLQALMAHYQLCLNNFEAASHSQQNAISLYQKSTEKSPSPLDQSDLLINQGVIHFLWAMSLLQARQSIPTKVEPEFIKLSTASREQLKLARDYYLQARELSPEDIFLRDEHVRICLSLAELSEQQNSSLTWQEVIEEIVDVICSEDADKLGLDSIRELQALMAHAYSKAGDFREARKLIGMLQSTANDDWFIYFVKACHFCMRSQRESNEQFLEDAFKALAKAASLNPKLKLKSIENESSLELLNLKYKKETAQLLTR